MADKQDQRNAAAAVLHQLKGEHDLVTIILEDYRGRGEKLIAAWLHMAKDFCEIVTEETSRSTGEILQSLKIEPKARTALEVVSIFVTSSSVDPLIEALRRPGADPLEFSREVMSVIQALFEEISALGGKPVHADDGSAESWLQEYLYWIAGDETPDEGYTYHRDDPRPCFVCGEPAYGRDPKGRPHHVRCVPGD